MCSSDLILIHMERPALGEMCLSEKKLSRRLRKTFGNEDALDGSPTECRAEASDGTRSSMSGFRLITVSVSDATGNFTWQFPETMLA